MSALISPCCRAPVNVEGRTTRYYECSACGAACDPIVDDNAEPAFEPGEPSRHGGKIEGGER